MPSLDFISQARPGTGSDRISRILERARNALRGRMQRYGTAAMKRFLWNREFAQGRWSCLEVMPNDCVYAHVERFANQGSVLDLGCGPGTTASELSETSFCSYTGVDISDVAISKARARTNGSGRTGKIEFVSADILLYKPSRKYDVILLGDSIYYVSLRRARAMLHRYSQHLKEDGVFIARIYGERYQPYIDVIEADFLILEKHAYVEARLWVITFKPTTKVPFQN